MKIFIEKPKHMFFLLGLIVLAVYANAFLNGFVYDDIYLVVNNPAIQSLAALKEVWFNDVTVMTPIGRASGYFRPVSMAFLVLGYQIWGQNPLGWHLTNVLLHFGCVLLVFSILVRLFKARLPACWAAILFAIHPIHVEAVSPIYNYMGLLAAFLSLLSFLCFLKMRAGWRMGRGASWLFFLMAVFAKEEAIILPGLFWLSDMYWGRREHPAGRPVLPKRPENFFCRILYPLRETWESWRGEWRFYGGAFLIVFFYMGVRGLFLEKAAAFGFWQLKLFFNILPPEHELGHWLTVFQVYARYLGLLMFPFFLSAFHLIPPATSLLAPKVVLEGMLVLAVLGYGFYFRKRDPLVSFFIMFFFISTFLFSNLIPIGGLFAERFMYFPSFAFCAVAAILFERGRVHFEKTPWQRSWVMAGASVGILFAVQTSVRNSVWHDNKTLWEDTVQKSPESIHVRLSLGDAYFSAGLDQKALVQYQKYLSMTNHKGFYVHNAIGKIYGRAGEYDAAIAEFTKTIALMPTFVEAYYNMGVSYFFKGELEPAVSHFDRGIALDPKYAWNYYGLGLVYSKAGNTSRTREMLQAALKADPNFRLAKQMLLNLR